MSEFRTARLNKKETNVILFVCILYVSYLNLMFFSYVGQVVVCVGLIISSFLHCWHNS